MGAKEKLVDVEAIREVFEEAVESREFREKRAIPAEYMDGVANALGWVLGEYEDKPIH